MNIVDKIKSYLDLIRIYSASGTLLLFLPGAWVIAMLAKNASDFFFWIIFFLMGSFVMRSAGCIINDIADQKYDANVLRTKSRPLACGKLELKNALFLLAFLLCFGLSMLIYIGGEAISIGFIVMALVIIYPFTKRFIKYPQIVLALIFNSGTLFASVAICGYVVGSAVLMYIGAFFWILYYDTIYAHQDKIYDKQIGLQSIALTQFGDRIWITRYYKIALLFWLFGGILCGLGAIYCVGIGGLFYIFYRQMEGLNLDDPNSCMNTFCFSKNIGFILLLTVIVARI